MDAFIHQKANTIEDLLNISSALLKEIDSGDLDQLDRALRQRARLFHQLESLDREMSGQPTAEDQKWMNQLTSLQQMDAAIQERLEYQLAGARRDMDRQQKAKMDMIRDELIEPKGHKVETRI